MSFLFNGSPPPFRAQTSHSVWLSFFTTVELLGWAMSRHKAATYTQDTTQTQNKHRHIPWLGFEPKISASEQTKGVYTWDCADTMTGSRNIIGLSIEKDTTGGICNGRGGGWENLVGRSTLTIWYKSEVAVRSKSWTVFARSNTGVVGSNPTRVMCVCARLFCVCVILCVGSGLVTGWSPV
jgi:hypothetical protein